MCIGVSPPGGRGAGGRANYEHAGVGNFMKELFFRHVRTKFKPKQKYELEPTDSIITGREIYTLLNIPIRTDVLPKYVIWKLILKAVVNKSNNINKWNNCIKEVISFFFVPPALCQLLRKRKTSSM